MAPEFQFDSVVQWTGLTLYICIVPTLVRGTFIRSKPNSENGRETRSVDQCASAPDFWNRWISLQFHIEFFICSIWSTNSCYVIHWHPCHRAFKRDQLISLVKQGFTVLVLGWVTAPLKGWIREEYFVYKIEMPPDWGSASRTENGRHPQPYQLLVHASFDDLQSFSPA